MVSYTPPSSISYPPESTVCSSSESISTVNVDRAEGCPLKQIRKDTKELSSFVSSFAVVTRTEQSASWFVFAAAIFLVSVPVFVQAPLVRFLPWVSLLFTPVLFGLGWCWLSRPGMQLWGDLLVGFAWTWLSGSIYWGWLRWEPLLHLPVEAIALPLALWGVARGWGKVGNCFYLGSLFGTAVTDVYFYLTNLIPHWRRLMQVEPEMARPIFQDAIVQVSTPWGVGWAVVLLSLLLVVAVLPLRSPQLHHRALHRWAFSGAVLSTILVDGLFWLAACFA